MIIDINQYRKNLNEKIKELENLILENENTISRKDEAIRQRERKIENEIIENNKLRNELLVVYREFFKRGLD